MTNCVEVSSEEKKSNSSSQLYYVNRNAYSVRHRNVIEIDARNVDGNFSWGVWVCGDDLCRDTLCAA